MSTVSSPRATIAVVDPASSDYESLLDAAEGSNASICFLSQGTEAIHFARQANVDLWLINAALPDMSGFDLARKLRRGRTGVRIFIIDDDYRLDDELQTLSLGLSSYICKPLDASRIRGWARPGVVPAMAVQRGMAAPMAESDDPVILSFVPQSHRRPAA
jgi:DNA-binding response OmpR family regulator